MIDEADLEEIYRRYDTPQLRDQARNALRNRTRQAAAGQPLTGAYYWVPIPGDAGKKFVWTIQVFFDGWLPNSDHIYIWKHIEDSLSRAWRREVRGFEYCSLPRGRICQCEPKSAGYALYHGNDSPEGPDGLIDVAKLFNHDGRCRFVFDEHEQMIEGQPEALSQRLGVDLGLVGVEASRLDWDEELV